jgi:hypothetical protein
VRQRLRRDQVVVALPALVEQDVAGDLGHPCRTGDLSGGRGSRQSCLRKIEVRRRAQCLLDQCIELRVLIDLPPSIARPGRLRGGERLCAPELCNLFDGRRRVHARKLRTAPGRNQTRSDQRLDEAPTGAGG